MELYFATGNSGKVKDAQTILDDTDVTVKQLDVNLVELQEASLEEIVTYKVEQAVERSQLLGTYIMADDSGLFVDALNGFPGILSSPFDTKVGKEKLLDLLDDEDDRTAEFRAAIALYDPITETVKTFTGSVKGTIVEPRGDDGFGYDPMFVPDGHNKTFAEDMEYKHQVSHRNAALQQLKQWLETR